MSALVKDLLIHLPILLPVSLVFANTEDYKKLNWNCGGYDFCIVTFIWFFSLRMLIWVTDYLTLYIGK